ncbi:MFS transporter [Cupriavidus pauculus]|nr:MFS transporter [Cupriavidus pauculus]
MSTPAGLALDTQGTLAGASDVPAPRRQHWAAVLAVAFSAAVFCTTEFMPVGLLRYIAQGLSVSEGAAGWMVSAPGLLAALAAPLVTVLAGRLDRRIVLWALGVLLVLANLTAALAPSFAVLVLGRVLFGVGLGGFWAIGAGIGSRLVEPAAAPKATSVIFAGVSVGMLVGGAAGAWIGEHWGWRAAFGLTTALSVAALLATLACLPPLRVTQRVKVASLWRIVATPAGRLGLLVMMIALIGQFAAYTYITPFLAHEVKLAGTLIPLVLFGYTLVGAAGNFVAGAFAGRAARATLMVAIAMIALPLGGLQAGVAHLVPVLLLLAVWGLGYGAMPVALQVWIDKVSEGAGEAGMALFVMNFQLSIALGAWAGGWLVDSAGIAHTLRVASGLVLAALLLLWRLAGRSDVPTPQV